MVRCNEILKIIEGRGRIANAEKWQVLTPRRTKEMFCFPIMVHRLFVVLSRIVYFCEKLLVAAIFEHIRKTQDEKSRTLLPPGIFFLKHDARPGGPAGTSIVASQHEWKNRLQ